MAPRPKYPLPRVSAKVLCSECGAAMRTAAVRFGPLRNSIRWVCPMCGHRPPDAVPRAWWWHRPSGSKKAA